MRHKSPSIRNSPPILQCAKLFRQFSSPAFYSILFNPNGMLSFFLFLLSFSYIIHTLHSWYLSFPGASHPGSFSSSPELPPPPSPSLAILFSFFSKLNFQSLWERYSYDVTSSPKIFPGMESRRIESRRKAQAGGEGRKATPWIFKKKM